MNNLRPESALGIPASRLSELMTDWLETTDPTTIWRNCTTCTNLHADVCQVFKKMPPPSVAVKGCPKYEDIVKTTPRFTQDFDDDIPF